MLRSLAFNLSYIAWTTALAVLGLPLLATRRSTQWLARLWARGILSLARRLCGIVPRIRGIEYIAAGPAIYAVKHQSALDIYLLIQLLPQPAFVLKKELMRLPLIGWYLKRAGMVPVDRKRGAKALRFMQEEALNALRRRQALVIFPEGTRMPPGKSGRYQRGVAALYQALKVPVVPVALATGQCWGRNALKKHPGTASLRFLPPIAPGQHAGEFMTQLREAIEGESKRMSDEG